MTDFCKVLFEPGKGVHRGYRAFRPVLVFCLVFFLTHCAPVPSPLPSLDEAMLLQRLQNNARAYQGLRGMTRIRTESPAGKNSARQVLLLSRPDRIRAEVLGPFGQPLLLLAAHDGQLSLSLPGEQRFLRGAATASRIARFAGAPLTSDQLVRLALYDVPLMAYDESSLIFSDSGYRLLLSGAEGEQRLDFDAAGRLLGASYLRGTESVLEVTYGRFDRELEDFPRQVSVTMDDGAASLSLTYTDIELNPELRARHFDLQPPPGVAVESLP